MTVTFMTVNQTVTPAGMSRKARFKAALAATSMTLRQWCSDRGRDEAHVSRVVAGKVPSAPVIAEVDAFIEAQSGNVNNAPTSAAETPSAV